CRWRHFLRYSPYFKLRNIKGINIPDFMNKQSFYILNCGEGFAQPRVVMQGWVTLYLIHRCVQLTLQRTLVVAAIKQICCLHADIFVLCAAPLGLVMPFRT